MLLSLAACLVGCVALTVHVALAVQDGDEQCALGEQGLRMSAEVRSRVLRMRHGTLVRAPQSQREARAMVFFCDRAEARHAAVLRDVALHAQDPLASANALRALGRLRSVAGDAELAALVGDARPRVREEAILAIGESGGADAVGLLRPLLRSDDPTARTLAIRALGRTRSDAAAHELRRVAADAASTREDRAFAAAACATCMR